jgi:hypothetical protein
MSETANQPDDEAVPWRIPWGCYLRLLWQGAACSVRRDRRGVFAEATLPDELIEQVADNRRQRRQAHSEVRYDRHMPHMR